MFSSLYVSPDNRPGFYRCSAQYSLCIPKGQSAFHGPALSIVGEENLVEMRVLETFLKIRESGIRYEIQNDLRSNEIP